MFAGGFHFGLQFSFLKLEPHVFAFPPIKIHFAGAKPKTRAKSENKTVFSFKISKASKTQVMPGPSKARPTASKSTRSVASWLFAVAIGNTFSGRAQVQCGTLRRQRHLRCQQLCVEKQGSPQAGTPNGGTLFALWHCA